MAVSTLRRWAQIVLTAVLLVAYWLLEHTPAWTAERVIHDKEMSLYKNPKSEDTISLIMLFVISFMVPAAVIIIVEFFRKDNIDVVQVVLDLTSTLALNGFITNVIKVFVARPRPDYFFGNPDEIIQGRKSFPSGHSSFAFSGLGFLSLYLMGKLQTQERIQGWKLCAALAPVALLAPVVAFTRHLDHRHHWGDIVAGSVLGLSLSYVCYTWTVVSWTVVS